MPFIPLDVIRIVLLHAIQGYAGHFRNELLTNACLVSKEWCDAAQTLLMAEITVHTYRRAYKLGKLLLDVGKASMVKSLQYGWPLSLDIEADSEIKLADDGTPVTYLTFLLCRCKYLEELQVDTLKVPPAQMVGHGGTPLAIPQLPTKLRKATFDDCPEAFLQRTRLLDSVTSLTINCQSRYPFSSLFNAPAFQLQYLSLTSFDWKLLSDWKPLFTSSLGSLRCLELHNYSGQDIVDVVQYAGAGLEKLVLTFGTSTKIVGKEQSALYYVARTCQKLRELVVWAEHISQPDFFEELPTGLRVLDLRDCAFVTLRLLEALAGMQLREGWRVVLPQLMWGIDASPMGSWTKREITMLGQMGPLEGLSAGTWIIEDSSYPSDTA